MPDEGEELMGDGRDRVVCAMICSSRVCVHMHARIMWAKFSYSCCEVGGCVYISGEVCVCGHSEIDVKESVCVYIFVCICAYVFVCMCDYNEMGMCTYVWSW